jgi:undecaprenyl pyrophosphate phosphatase UppP
VGGDGNMTRWIDGHVAPWLVLAVLLAFIVGGAVLIQRFFRRRTPVLRNKSRNDAVRFTYGFVGLFYSFFIGILVSGMWSATISADNDSRAEGATAVQMGIELRQFDKSDSDRIRQSLLDYERSAIDEWNSIDGARSAGADAALARLYDAYTHVTTTTEAQKAILTSSLGHLDSLSQARTVRLRTAAEDQGPGWALWFVILLVSALVVGTAIIYGVEDPVLHYPMVAIVSVIVAANLFIIVELSYPYVGAMSAEPDNLRDAMRILTG